MLNPQFGSGVLFGIPTAGNLATNPTPLQFGILQEVALNIKGDLKKLYGMYQAPLAKARGKIDVTAKGKIASLDPLFFSQLYFGLPTAVGVARPIFNEAHTAVASLAPTQVTASKDLGVIVTGGTGFSPGIQLTCSGTAAPATGQYKFTPYVTQGTVAAAYIFNAADVSAGLTVALNYVYPDATHGVTLSVTNQLMGFAPEFQALLYNNFRSNLFGVLLYSCVMGSLSIPTKQEDFWVSDFDFDASCDISGNLLDIFSDQL